MSSNSNVTEQNIISIKPPSYEQYVDLKTAYLDLVRSYHSLANVANPAKHLTLSVYNCEETTCKTFMRRLVEIDNGTV